MSAAEPGNAVIPRAKGDGKALRAADRILETARRLFYRDGIRAIGVDEIVRQAGVTKPSLYRSFSSKDELAATYLRRYDAEFWARFESCVVAHPGNPRAQFLDYAEGLADRAVKPGYRGCGLTNAAVEYPEPDHPARLVSEANKQELRRRLRAMAAEMGAADADALGDGLLLLLEGTFASSQVLGRDGPALELPKVAAALIDSMTSCN